MALISRRWDESDCLICQNQRKLLNPQWQTIVRGTSKLPGVKLNMFRLFPSWKGQWFVLTRIDTGIRFAFSLPILYILTATPYTQWIHYYETYKIALITHQKQCNRPLFMVIATLPCSQTEASGITECGTSYWRHKAPAGKHHHAKLRWFLYECGPLTELVTTIYFACVCHGENI